MRCTGEKQKEAMSENVLDGSTAVVTGASRGIGKAIAERFADEGANVAICSRRYNNVEPVEEAIADQARGDAIAVECDVTDKRAVERLFDIAVDEFGGIDVLVNNAGGAIDDGTLQEIDEETWDANVEVNLKGQYLCAKAALPRMVEDDGGAMVHMGTVNALFGIGLTAYSAAKSGLLALSRNIAVQYGHVGIRSNVISPGTIETKARREEMDETTAEMDDAEQAAREEWLDQYPLGRFGRPEEVAKATLFLASERSSFVTGTNLVVDGGLTVGTDRSFQEQIYGDEWSDPS